MFKKGKRSLSALTANLVFLLLFPGFFFYQSAIGQGVIQPVLGGFFGSISVLTFPLTLLAFMCSIGRFKHSYTLIDVIFVAVMLINIVAALLNFLLDRPLFFSKEMLMWSGSGILYNLECYFLARTVSLDNKLLNSFLMFSVVAMALIVLSNIGDKGIYNLRDSSGSIEFIATYQGFARSLAVTGIFLLGVLRPWKFSLTLFLIVLIGLYFNGARTEFALFIIAYASFIVYASASSLKMIAISGLSLASGLIFLALNFESMRAVLPENRMLELTNIFSSSSWQAREHFTSAGIELISASPWLGDYGGYSYHCGIGCYPHNLMSAWVNLGFAGFASYALTLFLVVVGLMARFQSSRAATTEGRVAVFFSVFTMLALFLAKDYTYMLFGMMVGFYARFNVASRYNPRMRASI
jgi:hypothetical protein